MQSARSTRPLTLAAIAASALAAGVLIANAGPLDPPAGPPQPTGRTLNEVSDRIEQVETAVNDSGNGPQLDSFAFRFDSPDTAVLQGTGRVRVQHVIITKGAVELKGAGGSGRSTERLNSIYSAAGTQYLGSVSIPLGLEFELPLVLSNTFGVAGESVGLVVYTEVVAN